MAQRSSQPTTEPSADAAFVAAIAELNAIANGSGTDFTKLDEIAKRNLAEFSNPRERGQLLARLAAINALGGPTRLTETASLCKQALQNQLRPAERLQMYIYWGDASQHMNPADPSMPPHVIYVSGLVEAQALGLPAVAPQIPPVSLFDIGPQNSPEFQAHQREFEKQAVAQQQAIETGKLLAERAALIDGLATVYHRNPNAHGELEHLAHDKFKDPAEAEKIVADVEKAITDSKQRQPMPP